MQTLLASLAALTVRHPHERKLFVVPDVHYGRELLLALARETGGWVGWQPITLKSIAESITFVPLSESGRRVADDVEVTTLSGQAIDWMLASGLGSDGFRERATGLGFRAAVRDAMLALQIAGATDAVRRVVVDGSAAADTLTALARYEEQLDDAALVDAAGLFDLALAHFDAESPFVLDGVLVIAPGLLTAGLPGRLLTRLIDRGAMEAAGDCPAGVDLPARSVERLFADRATAGASSSSSGTGRTVLGWAAAPDRLVALPDETQPPAESLADVAFFHAVNPAAELREVLRHAVAAGLRWDDVEIVTTDPDGYGVELDGLCARLGIRASLLQGVPLGRTRIGRALTRYLTWLETGLPAATLRAALEAGEINAPELTGTDADSDGGWLPAVAVARTLRSMRIGWGRDRYERALRALTDGTFVTGTGPRDGDTDVETEARHARRTREAAALARLLAHLLAATPPVPNIDGIDQVRVSTRQLATAALGYLELVKVRGDAELRTMARLRGRLERLGDIEEPAKHFGSAMATFREALADLRAWSDVSDQKKPWAADGGALHLTDLAHAGTTGRPHIFVVGLDADRVGTARLQDPVLVDSLRHAAGDPGLPPSSVRAGEQRWRLLAALAGLRGHVTLSYSIRSTDGSDTGPCAMLLGAHRAVTRNPDETYEQFITSLGAPACAVPTDEAAALDRRDAWLAALGAGGLLLDGASAVREAFPQTGRGLDVHEALSGDVLTEFHGLVPAAAGMFDPRVHAERPLSPSSLELLAACPRAWFYRYGLHLSAPDEAAYDPDCWLDAKQRGSLLHSVYEAFGREYQGRQEEIAEPAAKERLRLIVESEIAAMETIVPPPSRTVFDVECAELTRSADAFLEMERAALADGARWQSFETEFGFSEPAYLVLPDGRRFAVRGRMDRVDRLADGTLRIIDYKTGSSSRFARNAKAAPFKGGRQLQPAVYLLAAGECFGAPVARFEYRFPTVRGQNAEVPYTSAESQAAGPVIESLLAHVAEGSFVPTTDCADCRYCDFAVICRVQTGSGPFATTESPLARWAAEHAPALPEYTGMNARREPAQ